MPSFAFACLWVPRYEVGTMNWLQRWQKIPLYLRTLIGMALGAMVGLWQGPEAVALAKPGSRVKLGVLRDGQAMTLPVEVGTVGQASVVFLREAEAQQVLDDNAHLSSPLSIKYDPCGFHG
jgi:hypothetical protein